VSQKAVSEAANRLQGSIGLAARAGRIKVGYDAVTAAVRDGAAFAVVVAGDAPEDVKNKLERFLTAHDVPFRVVLDGDRLGRSIGRERSIALAITDGSLGRRVIELAKELEG
jgi:ribosomal protein L7Ae-like RNA K-turn-binding protein